MHKDIRACVLGQALGILVSYSFQMGDLILGGVSRLDAFSVYLVQT